MFKRYWGGAQVPQNLTKILQNAYIVKDHYLAILLVTSYYGNWDELQQCKPVGPSVPLAALVIIITVYDLSSRFVRLKMTMKRTTILWPLLVCYSVRWRHLQFWKLTTRGMLLKQETQTWESPSQHLNFMPPYTQQGKMQSVSCSCQLILWKLWVKFCLLTIKIS